MREKIPLRKVERFHQMRESIPDTIRDTLDDGEIVHGSAAINAQVPEHLASPTQDIDVFAKNPLREAKEAERELDRRFGGDYFYVKPGEHKGTYKVKSRINDETYADFTKQPKGIKATNIAGLRMQTLAQIKKRKLQLLKQKDTEFRRAKDRDQLNRIKITENIRNVWGMSSSPLKNKKKEKKAKWLF